MNHPLDLATDVLIVGGGATGLSASMLLSQYGIASCVVSKYKQTSPLPKAHLLSIKTMEIFREIGIEDAIRAVACPDENMRYVGWYAGLAGPTPDHGREIARLGAFGRGGLDNDWRAASDNSYTNLAQAQLEPLLRARAEELAPGGIRFYHQFQSFKQDAQGVQAQVLDRDSGTTYTVRAKYLLACDGGQTVGAQLGIEMQGHDAVATTISVHFAADLSRYFPAGETSDVLNRTILNPDVGEPGVLVPMGPTTWGVHSPHWVFNMIAAPGEHKPYTDEEVARRTCAILGIPREHIEVLQISRWALNATVASKYRIGRAFILGDAAHRMPPAGAHGLNSAVQDSYNLCWKLAAVLRGQAGDALLDTYEQERRPVAQKIVASAYENWQNAWKIAAAFGFSPGQGPQENWAALRRLWAEGADADAARRRATAGMGIARTTYNHLQANFGYVYAQGALLADDLPAPAPLDAICDFRPSTKPGHSLPHAWLENTRGRYSIYDLTAAGHFVLIAGEDAGDWCDAARAIARQRGIPLHACTIGIDRGEHFDLSGEWSKKREFGPGGAILVRPDRFIAWRSMGASSNARAALDQALQEVLAWA
ncbi:MAG: FAD-dependent monooxygenase [Comamonas sp.]